jgi:hypothetical protein
MTKQQEEFDLTNYQSIDGGVWISEKDNMSMENNQEQP